MLDGVHREGAQPVAQVAPGVEVPVVAVVHEALRGDLALGGLVGAAGVVADDQALAAQQRRADGLEMIEVEFARADGLDADAAVHLLGGVVGGAEQPREAREQRLDLRPQQPAGVEVGEQVLHGEQRVDLLGGEPEAREFVLGADALALHLDAVAAQRPVEDDWSVEAILEVIEIPLAGGPRDTEPLLQLVAGDEAAASQDLVDLLDAFECAHGEFRRGEGKL